MNALALRIARLVEAGGPMSLADYMHLCMADPQHGYYAKRPAIGAQGDFVTAPEISQMFGELLGVWCASAWLAAGSPSPFVLAEAGPGRGTLMADLLRATAAIPGFRDAARVRLVETSADMRAAQRDRLAGLHPDIDWTESLPGPEGGPLLLVANEFLDVLPVRQYVKAGGAWRERCVVADVAGKLSTVLGAGAIDATILPPGHEAEPDGAVFEHAPAREAWVWQLAERLSEHGGAALLIDYGHGKSGFGDTFQAMRGHAAADPFAEPGMADLTAHVDFQRLAAAASEAGAVASPVVAQGEFLLDMGLAERAGRLGAGRDRAVQERLRGEAERLAGGAGMGSLFKALALCAPQWEAALESLPPFARRPAARPADPPAD